MSAYLCDAAHLAAIARALVAVAGSAYTPDQDAEALFGLLLDENLKSIACRYPDAARISDWFDEGEAAFVWANVPPAEHTATELLELVRSYRYQSCEHDAWEESTACRATELLALALTPAAKLEAEAKQADEGRRRRALAALPSLSPKETAIHIRKLLKAKFPATTFRVVTNRGSMVSSVGVSWTDGPTPAQVDALVGCFEAGHFDGMTDSYEYNTDTALVIDGVAYRAGTRYVQTSRTISAALANRCIAQLVAYWGGVAEVPMAVQAGTFFQLEPAGIGHRTPRPDLEGYRYDWHSLIHQAAGDRSKFLPSQWTDERASA